jgi:hypothetical protein
MNKKLLKRGIEVFTEGFKKQLTDDPTTWGAATVLGLHQGLKYKGDFRNGVMTGIAVLGVIGTVNGVRSIVKNLDYIKG